jgi:protein gp37
VTGCLHNCPYCYARDIATSGRFADAFPQKFAPVIRPDRLHAPRHTRIPRRADRDTSLKNVFVCSMADLFGNWVPAAWIEAVLAEVEGAPQWNFLFLTKFPQRMAEFEYPDNAWPGISVDCNARVANAERAFAKVKCKTKWLSVEPMLERLQFSMLGLFQWIVMGGASRSTLTPRWTPPLDWVTNLHGAGARCRIEDLLQRQLRLRRV